jgi:predicted lysophospholipase L1 biosynthesis ABC-type transport system permease subunit
MLLAVAARRITEVGFLIGGLGALVIAYGALRVIRGSQERHRERSATLIGALLIGLAFLLQLIALVSGPKAATPPTSTPTVTITPTPSSR